jgi:hypothetical protein
LEGNAIERKAAASGHVDYASPIVLSETSKTRVSAIPFFIQHSDHSELSLKIQTMRKTDPPFNWVEIEDKSITLSEEATRKLAAELPKYYAVAGEDSAGDYVVVRMSDGYTDVANLDPDVAVSALITALGQEDIAAHLSGIELGEGLTKALRYSVRLSEMKTAMTELRGLLDGGTNDERFYQAWCEEHPWAFGNNFVVNDDIRDITIQDQVDILVPRLLAGFRDIIELKRPDVEVLRYDESHRDYYFSSDVSKAIGQCHRYLDVFTEAAKNGLIGNEHIVAYHPEATIVMGRMVEWPEEKCKALHGLNARLSGIRIITYDHLLAQGESLIDYLSNVENQEEAETPF